MGNESPETKDRTLLKRWQSQVGTQLRTLNSVFFCCPKTACLLEWALPPSYTSPSSPGPSDLGPRGLVRALC